MSAKRETGAKAVSGKSSEPEPKAGSTKKGWGIEDLPFPKGVGYVQTRWDLCIGCGLCVTGCPGDIAKLQPKSDDQVVHPPVDYPTWERERLLNRELMD